MNSICKEENQKKLIFLFFSVLRRKSLFKDGILPLFEIFSVLKLGGRAVGDFFCAVFVFRNGFLSWNTEGFASVVTGVYGLCVTLATSGINLAVVKLVSEIYARAERSECTDTSVLLKAVLKKAVLYCLLFSVPTAAGVFFGSGAIGTNILKDERTVLSLKAFALSLPAVSVSSALAGYFTGVRKVFKNAAVSVLEQGAKIFIITLGLLLLAPQGLEYACLAIVGGGALAEGASLISSFLFFITDKSGGDRTPKSGGRCSGKFFCSFRDVASLALPVAVGSYARQGLLTAEHLAIPVCLAAYGMSRSEALSAYGVLHGMVMPLILFPSAVLYAFSSLLVPELSECAALGNMDRARRIGEKVFRISLFFSLGVAGVFLAFSRAFGIGIYESEEAARQLRLISVLIPVMYLDSAVDGMLKGLGEQVFCMKVNVVDSALCLVLVTVLVPKFGIDGYIALTVISEIVNASLSIMRLLKVTGIKIRYLKWIILPIFSISAAVLFARLICTEEGKLSVTVAVSAALYILFSVAFGAVGRVVPSKFLAKRKGTDAKNKSVSF